MALRLGISGGLGSGKTAFARALERRGVPVFFADDEAKRLYDVDDTLRADLVATFGPETFRPDGAFDRPRMAARVFSDAEALARLNALVHPRVFAAWQRFADAHGDAPVVAHESAILYESGGDAHVDVVVWIDAPRETRIARALARDPHLTRADVEQRLARQLDPAEARGRADFVVDNTGSLAALDAHADRVLNALRLA